MSAKSRWLAGASALLSLATAVQAQAPLVSALSWMQGDQASGAARESQSMPALAWGSDSYLMAWTDGRGRLPSEFGTQTDDDVFAARVDADGHLIDKVPFPIALGYGYQRNPQIAWNGSTWLVAWVNQTQTAGYYESRVWAVRVGTDGRVLGNPFQVMPTGSGYTHYFSLTSNGSEWCVLTQADTGSGLVAARISAQGTVLDPAGVVLVPPTYYLYFQYRVVSAQGEYLVTWQGNSAQYAQRFDSSLAPLGAPFTVPGSAIGSNGSGYYVAWTSGGSLVGSPMGISGALALPGGNAILPNAAGLYEVTAPSWDGSSWWVAWLHATQGVTAARVSPVGTVLDPGGVAVNPAHASSMRQVAIAGSLLGGAQTAWADFRVELYDVYGARFDAAGNVGADAPMSLSAGAQRRPKLTVGPDGQWLATAVSELSGKRRIVAWRLDAAGQALDLEPIEVAAGADATTPSVAFDGTRFLFVWAQGGSILARRMLPGGAFLDASPFPVMKGWLPGVAALNGVFLVVCANAPSYPQFVHPFSRRVEGATGALLDPAPVALGQYYVRALAVSAFGPRWLVVWQRNWSHDDPQSGLDAAFVDPSGTPTSYMSLVFAGAGAPALDVSPTRALIAYRTGSMSSANNDVAALVLNPDGSTAKPSFVISNPSGAGWAKQFSPAVAWNGSSFLIAWEDQRHQVNFFDSRSDIYAARVTESGTLLDPAGFPLANAAEPECYAALAGGTGKVLFAASILRPTPPHAAYRVATRVVFEGCPSPVGYCTSLPNSSGQAATISAVGSGSLSANNLTLSAQGLPAGGIGLFFLAPKAMDPPVALGNGLLCASAPFVRLAPFGFSGGAANQAQNLAGPAYAGVQAGDTRFVQFWFRDPAAGAGASNLSTALAIPLCP